MSGAKYMSISVKRSLNNTDTYGTFKPRLEKGNVDTSYDDYVEPITTNIYLDEPLRKIGDYADYIDFKNGKVVRKIIEFICDSSMTINNYTYNSDLDNTYHFNIRSSNEKIIPRTNMFCNILNSGDLVMSDKLESFITTRYTADGYPFYAQIEKALIDGYEGDTVADKFKNFLVNHNAKMYLCKKTPTEETIELPNIPTLKGTTILEVDTTIQPSNLEVVYKGNKVKTDSA